MTIQTLNPTTGEIIATYQAMSRTEVTGIIGRAQNAFNSWKLVGSRKVDMVGSYPITG